MKKVLAHVCLALVATLASSLVPREVFALIPGSEDCVQGCMFVAGGWPLAYLVDHHGISPVGSVSLLMGLTGDDHVRTTGFWLNFIFWLTVSVVAWNGLRRWRQYR
jgi:hypothetical protein